MSTYGRSKNKAAKGCGNCGRVKHMHRKTGLGLLLCPIRFKSRDLSRPMTEFVYLEPYAGRYSEQKRLKSLGLLEQCAVVKG